MNLLGIIFLVALSSTVFAGYGSINNIWKKKKINVCFSTNFNPHNLCNIVVPGINNPIEELEKLSATFSLPSESEKAQIASWVNSEFTIKRTGIEFQNWGDCKRLNNRDYGKTDAVIFFTKIANSAQSSGRAHLGACI